MPAPHPAGYISYQVKRFLDKNRRGIILTVTIVGLAFLLHLLGPDTRLIIITGITKHPGLLVLLWIFGLLTLSLLWSAGQRLDARIFLYMNIHQHHPIWMDRLMWIYTQIGNGASGILLCASIYLHGDHQIAIKMLLGIISLWLTVELIKAIVERSRPFLSMDGARIIGWRERGKSFPSGHTSQAFFMASEISHQFGSDIWATAILYAAAALVGFTRIYVGAHFPRDVLGGIILGSIWGVISGLIAL